MVPPGEVSSIATKSGTSATQASQPGPRGESATTESAAERSAPTKHHTPRWLLAVLVPVMAIFIVCLVNALAWIGRPFPGFLIAQNGIVVSIGRAAWIHARNHNVSFARILAVDGRPVAGGRDVHAYVTAAGIGKPIVYTFRNGTEIFRLPVRVRLFAAADFAELFVPLLGVGLLMVLVSAAVVVRRPGAPEARALFVLCLAIGLTLITAPDQYHPYRFTSLYFMATCMAPPAFVQLGLTYPQRSTLLERGPLAYAVLYLPFVALGAGLLASLPEPSLFLPLLYTLYFFVANAALLCVGALVLGLIDGVRPREPVLLCLVGMLGSCLIAGSILATYPLLPWPISPLWFLGPLLIFPVCEGAAFLRYPAPAVPATEGVAA
jgi:hypothetical protein